MLLPLSAIASRGQHPHVPHMTKRATTRPTGFVKPPHWSNDPLPTPAEPVLDEELSPTRYGDWVNKGFVAVDF